MASQRSVASSGAVAAVRRPRRASWRFSVIRGQPQAGRRCRRRRWPGATSSRSSPPRARSSPSASSTSAPTSPAASSQLSVKEGDRVKQGQVLARIDSDALRGGRAPVRGGGAGRPGRPRPRAGRPRGVASSAFERTQQMHAGEAGLRPGLRPGGRRAQDEDGRGGGRSAGGSAQLRPQLDSNRDDLEKTTVVSPMDGVVTSLQKEEGEVVIGAQSFSPTVIMTVADLSVMEVRDPGGRDGHPQRGAGPGGGGAGGRPRGREDQGRGHGDRLLRHPPRRRHHGRDAADRGQHREPGQGLQGHGHAQGPARHACARA